MKGRRFPGVLRGVVGLTVAGLSLAASPLGHAVLATGSPTEPAPANVESIDIPGQEEDWTFSLYVENDLFVRTDRYYTSGTKLSWLSPNLHQAFNDSERIPDWLRPVVRALPLVHDAGVAKNVSFSLGQSLYTPGNITATELLVDDRPYAAWLYTAVALHNRTARWADTVELSLGVVGPWALGEEAQNLVHRWRDRPQARGWHHQIENEPTLNLVWERKTRRILWGDGDGGGADIVGHVGAAAGNMYIYANGGGSLRLGWNLPQDFGTSPIRLAGESNGPLGLEESPPEVDYSFGFHLFGAVDSRLVGRDMTIDGNTFRDSHSVEREWLVSDVSSGLALVLGRSKLSYALTYRTPAFAGGDPQKFGSINFSFVY